MFQKNPLSFNIVRYMSVFDLKVLLNQPPSACKSLFGKLVCALVGSKIISSSQGHKALWSNGLMVKVLDSQSKGLCSKLLGGSKVNSAFHPSKVDNVEFIGT